MMIAIGLLADDAPRDTGPDFGKASPFGLVIVVLLLIGTLVVWSMNRHLRKLPKSFDDAEPDQAADEDTETPGVSPAAESGRQAMALKRRAAQTWTTAMPSRRRYALVPVVMTSNSTVSSGS